ncbi:MAG: hypothetical protein GXO55_09610, partial [Chloroflexi bacterium]|nr:hypothetical protein [Chloroflexota bacterium]
MQESRERYFRRGALVLVMAYLFLALGHSVLNPICETSDEYWHIGFVAHLARGGTLPVQQPGVKTPWRQEGSQPSLYYWFEASLARLLHLPLADVAQACPPNPHANLGDATQLANRNLVLHGPWQRYPWSGMVFTIHFWRIVSVLMGLGTVLGAIWLTRTLFPRQPTWSLAVGAFVAFNPMYLFITSAVSNDALVIPLTTLTLALAAHSWRFGPTLRTSLLLGLLAGGAALTKLSGLTVWPWVAVALFLGARARGDSRAAWQYPLLALGSALLVSGWWFWRNWTLYHDP